MQVYRFLIKIGLTNLILIIIDQMQFVVRRVMGSYSFSGIGRKSKKGNQKRVDFEGTPSPDVFNAYRNQMEKSSVLREFRQEVFRRSELNVDWEKSKNKQAKQVEEMKNILKGTSKEQVLNRAKKVEERLMSKRNIFHQHESKSLLSDYGDYTPYNKVYPTIEDRNLGQNEFLEHDHVIQNSYKFIDSLPEGYLEKQSLSSRLSDLPYKYKNLTLAQYGELIQNKLNDQKDETLKNDELAKIHKLDKTQLSVQIQEGNLRYEGVAHPYTGTSKSVDPWSNEEHIDATLSPQAVDTIYELYLQGWTVRQISKRYGILPARTKFCVWVRAQLYHEIIPKLGVNFYMRALKFERQYLENATFCDYGLDLEELDNDHIINQITQWNPGMLDAERKEDEYLGAMKMLETKKKFNKYEMVEIGTHGKENSMHRLKEWHIFRGKGSDEYFLKYRAFRELSKAQLKFNKVYF